MSLHRPVLVRSAYDAELESGLGCTYGCGIRLTCARRRGRAEGGTGRGSETLWWGRIGRGRLCVGCGSSVGGGCVGVAFAASESRIHEGCGGRTGGGNERGSRRQSGALVSVRPRPSDSQCISNSIGFNTETNECIQTQRNNYSVSKKRYSNLKSDFFLWHHDPSQSK